MRCEKVKEMLSLYIDNELDEQKRIEIENHIQTCEECSREYEDLLTIKKLLSETPQVELPDDFKEELHKKLVECTIEEKDHVIDIGKKTKKALRNKKKINWKALSGVAAALLLTVISVSSLKDKNFEADEAPKYEMAESAPDISLAKSENKADLNDKLKQHAPMEYSGTQMDSPQMSIATEDRGNVSKNQLQAKEARVGNRQIIFSGYLHIKVEDYDTTSKKITDLVMLRGGGTAESSESSNEESTEDALKTGKIIVRIPYNEFHNLFYEISNMGEVVNENISSSDISKQYNDVSEQIIELEKQEKSLLEAKDDSEAKSKLIVVREAIAKLKENLKQWSDLVELSTIEIYLEEVEVKDNTNEG